MKEISRRKFLKIVRYGALGLAGSAFLMDCGLMSGPPKGQKPNFVFILIDDLGWKDLGCYGSRFYETPNIDRLASQGIKFTNAYANAPNCAPSRACLISGQYTPRHGIFTVGDPIRGRLEDRKLIPPKNNRTLASEEVTIAEALKVRGYTSASIGKWHLGAPPKNGPKGQGFDINIASNEIGRPRSYFSPYRNKNLEDGPKDEYLTDRLTDEALKFIERNKDKLFFLYLSHYAVHGPHQAKKELISKYKKKPGSNGQSNAKYAAMIESVDLSAGRIMDKLDELKLTDNTVVIFFSDNGALGGYRELGIPNHEVTSNAPLHGGKGMLYEGGIREPMIVRWPGKVKPGSICDEPVIGIDFYPTMLEMAGIKSNPKQELDGVSLVPLLKQTGTLKRDVIFWHFPAYLQAMHGFCRTTPSGAVRRGDFKLIEFFEDSHLELYNLKKDIGEKNNLANRMPEKTKELHKLLVDWRESINAPMPTPNPDYNPAKAHKGVK